MHVECLGHMGKGRDVIQINFTFFTWIKMLVTRKLNITDVALILFIWQCSPREPRRRGPVISPQSLGIDFSQSSQVVVISTTPVW